MVDCNASFAQIAGITNQTFSATSNGSYAVIVSDDICTETSSCLNVTTMAIDKENVSAKSFIYIILQTICLIFKLNQLF